VRSQLLVRNEIREPPAHVRNGSPSLGSKAETP
jgi:hypothetical protein